jgi:hypothetical protein
MDGDDGDRSNYQDSIWRKSEFETEMLGATLVSRHSHGRNGEQNNPSKDGKEVWWMGPALGAYSGGTRLVGEVVHTVKCLSVRASEASRFQPRDTLPHSVVVFPSLFLLSGLV